MSGTHITDMCIFGCGYVVQLPGGMAVCKVIWSKAVWCRMLGTMKSAGYIMVWAHGGEALWLGQKSLLLG